MFQKNPGPAGNAPKQSPFQAAVSGLGTALGIGVAILATPAVFEQTRPALLNYLTDAWGAKLGSFLTWTFGAVEAFILYAFVKLLILGLIVGTTAALAARRG